MVVIFFFYALKLSVLSRTTDYFKVHGWPFVGGGGGGLNF